MDFNWAKSLFKGKDKNAASDGGKKNASGGGGRQERKTGGKRNAASGARGGMGGGKSGGGAKTDGRGKIAPVSPSRARLERRANDDKIIKNIKIAFTAIITVAIIGIVLSIFLYVYKPTVATVGGVGIEQFEFIYQLNISSNYTSEYSTVESLGQQSINNAAEMKIWETIAKERGIALTAEDREGINSQIEYIDQLAASNSTGAATQMTGDDYLRSNIGVNKSQYKKLLESELLANYLMEMEYDQITVPDEDAQNMYDNNIASYDEATVRHILFLYEGQLDDGTTREQEESEQLAIDTVERINAGEDMAELVQELSEDTDLSNEGIYVFKRTDGFEQGFLDWTFDPERQIGDVGICETSYGYHVMRLEDFRRIPFEEAKDEIVDGIKTDEIEAITASWKEDSRFQLQINQRVYDSVISQTYGTY